MFSEPDVLVAIIGAVTAVITPFLQSLIVPRKSRLRKDIEMLETLRANPDYGEGDSYKLLKEAVNRQVQQIYSTSKLSHETRVGYICSGSFLIVLFGYFSYLLYSPFNLWFFLTAYLTVAGSLYLFAGLLGQGTFFERIKLIPK